MTLYLLRRFLQCILFILLAWLTVYTVVVYIMPHGPKAQYDSLVVRILGPGSGSGPGTPGAQDATGTPHRTPTPDQQEALDSITREFDVRYGIARPWPVSFFSWLFDPGDTADVVQVGDEIREVPKGIDLSIGGWRIKGSGMLTGDFGKTEPNTRLANSKEQPITDLLGSRMGNTSLLIGLSFLVALLLAFPVGIASAARQRTGVDHALSFVSLAGISLPPFTLATLLVVVMGVLPYRLHNAWGWDWLPYLPSGFVADTDQYDNPANRLYHLALPVLTLALPQIAWLSRQLRFSILDVLRQDYIRTARAKGLPARRVMLKHVLRNALLPLITAVALALPAFISGATMVETVFGYTGLGQIYYRALGGCLASGPSVEFFCPPDQNLLPMDHPTTLALTFLIIIVVAFANMAADILYTVVDPRVDYTGGRPGK